MKVSYLDIDVILHHSMDHKKVLESVLSIRGVEKVMLSIDERETDLENGHLKIYGKDLKVDEIIEKVKSLGFVFNGIDEIEMVK